MSETHLTLITSTTRYNFSNRSENHPKSNETFMSFFYCKELITFGGCALNVDTSGQFQERMIIVIFVISETRGMQYQIVRVTLRH